MEFAPNYIFRHVLAACPPQSILSALDNQIFDPRTRPFRGIQGCVKTFLFFLVCVSVFVLFFPVATSIGVHHGVRYPCLLPVCNRGNTNRRLGETRLQEPALLRVYIPLNQSTPVDQSAVLCHTSIEQTNSITSIAVSFFGTSSA